MTPCKTTYFLICRAHGFCLYQHDGRAGQLISSATHYQPVLEAFARLCRLPPSPGSPGRSVSLTILDGMTASSVIRYEQLGRALGVYAYLAWFRQQMWQARQQMPYANIIPIFSQHSCLTLASKPSTLVTQLSQAIGSLSLRADLTASSDCTDSSLPQELGLSWASWPGGLLAAVAMRLGLSGRAFDPKRSVASTRQPFFRQDDPSRVGFGGHTKDQHPLPDTASGQSSASPVAENTAANGFAVHPGGNGPGRRTPLTCLWRRGLFSGPMVFWLIGRLASMGSASSGRALRSITPLVLIDDDGQVLLSGWSSGDLCFVRTASGGGLSGPGVRNIIEDGLNHLNRLRPLAPAPAIFVLESNRFMADLKGKFPGHTILRPQDLLDDQTQDAHESPGFNELICAFPGTTVPLPMGYGAGTWLGAGFAGPDAWYRRFWGAVRRFVMDRWSSARPLGFLDVGRRGRFLCAGLWLVTIISFGLCLRLAYLHKENQRRQDQLVGLSQRLHHLSQRLANLPIERQHLPALVSLGQQTTRQYHKFRQFLDLLRHVLGDRHLMGRMTLGKKQARLTIYSIDSWAQWDSFLELWQSTLADYLPTKMPDAAQDHLLLDIPSVFDDDKAT
jgi:hypothetical protein